MLRRHLFENRAIRASAATIAMFVISGAAHGGGVLYVDDDAPLGGDGTSWDTAYRFLQDALLNASQGDRIWVAQGVYYPDQGAGQTEGDVSATFQLVDFVSVLGGFAGDETEEDERDPDQNETILSGDIGVSGDDSDNSTRVVLVPSVDDSTVLDGFTITSGRAESDGGGMRIPFGSGNPTVINCHFIDNQAGDEGGAVYSRGQPTFVDCTFSENSSGNQGGAVWCFTTSFVGCVFEGNDSQEGGAVFVDSGGTSFIECSFIDNAAAVEGGGVSVHNDITFERCTFLNNATPGHGGGVFGFGVSPSDSTVIDCAFIGNTAGGAGGGIANAQGGTSKYYGCIFIGNVGTVGGGLDDGANTTIANCLFSGNLASATGGGFTNDFGTLIVADSTFTANSAMDGGGGIYVTAGDVTVTNCVLWGNDVNKVKDEAAQIASTKPIALNFSCVQGLTGQYDGTGNIDADPMFVAPRIGNYHLSSGSPCIDAGNNWGVPIDSPDYDEDGVLCELFPVDLDGNPRFNADEADFDPGCGIPVVVDMGAYEYQFDPVDQVTFADLNADGAVGVADLLELLANWGPCGKGCCLADVDIDGTVGLSDLLALLANWGPCM